ncbi:hypothetical protein AA3271_0276 [Gluconobacter japonicus NBRC 3271]|nr:hypothetical protein AA3271_0276 [Gluconobacter japonicus NBRC 3271]
MRQMISDCTGPDTDGPACQIIWTIGPNATVAFSNPDQFFTSPPDCQNFIVNNQGFYGFFTLWSGNKTARQKAGFGKVLNFLLSGSGLVARMLFMMRL